MNNWGENWGTTAPNGHGGYIYETRLANASGETAAYFTVTPKPEPPVPPVPPVPPTPPTPVSIPGWIWYVLGGLVLAVLGFILGRKI